MKTTSVLASLILTIALITTGCKQEEEKTVAEVTVAMDLETAKSAVNANTREYERAFNAKDAGAVANCYTTDALLMPPNQKAVEGKESIRRLFAAWFKGNTPKIKLEVVEVWSSDKNLTAESSWEMTLDGKVIDTGKSLEIYKLEDGKWRMLRDCFNSDMPLVPENK